MNIPIVFLLAVISFVLTEAHTTAASSHVQYHLVEEGVIPKSGRSFQRYQATTTKGSEGQQPAPNNKAGSFQDWIKALQHGDISHLNEVLTKAPYNAFYFEVLPITRAMSYTTPFAFVLVDAPSLVKRRPRFLPFQGACRQASGNLGDDGCVFSNLSGDATLIVPKPLPRHQDGTTSGITTTEMESYTHLANFVRTAPAGQVSSLWKLLADAFADELSSPAGGEANIWLSTAGNGVPWLHFRLDSVPKYYRFPLYKVPFVFSEAEEEL